MPKPIVEEKENDIAGVEKLDSFMDEKETKEEGKDSVSKEEEKVNNMFDEIKDFSIDDDFDLKEEPFTKDKELRDGKKKEEVKEEIKEEVEDVKEEEPEEVEELIPPVKEEVREVPQNNFVPPKDLKEFNEKLLKEFVDNPFAVINNIIDTKLAKDEKFKNAIFEVVGIKQADVSRVQREKSNQIYSKLSGPVEKGGLKDFDKYIPAMEKLKKTMSSSELNILNKDPEGGMRMLHKMAVAMDIKKKSMGVDSIEGVPSSGGGKPKTRDGELSDLEEKIRRKAGMTREEYNKYKDKE